MPPAKTAKKFNEETRRPLGDDEDEVDAHPVATRAGRFGKESEGRARGEIRPAFRSIPTWDDAIGVMVAKTWNLAAKAKTAAEIRIKTAADARQ